MNVLKGILSKTLHLTVIFQNNSFNNKQSKEYLTIPSILFKQKAESMQILILHNSASYIILYS